MCIRDRLKAIICVLLKIEIITEKRTINPPIFSIVKIEFFIAVDNISPILERLTIVFIIWVVEEEVPIFTSLYFQNLKIIPTVNDAKIWVINNIIPVEVSLKSPIPIVPKINRGPELLVNANKPVSYTHLTCRSNKDERWWSFSTF